MWVLGSTCVTSILSSHLASACPNSKADQAGLRLQVPCAAQILNHLAPAQLATGDAAGFFGMLQSSLTLARSQHDLPTQVELA